jgi:hypothetical protein
LARETEVLGENLPQCCFVHHKSHMLPYYANLGPRCGKQESNRLSYGTVSDEACDRPNLLHLRGRYCPFSDLSTVTGLLERKVYWLVMTCFSYLDKGTTAVFSFTFCLKYRKGQGHKEASLKFSEVVKFVLTCVAVIKCLRKGVTRP